MSANLKTQQWSQVCKRSVFIPIPQNGNAKDCSNYHTTALISHASKVMFKVLQARLHSARYEPRISRCTRQVQKRQRNQRLNCQHSVDHRKSKRILEKHLLLFCTKAFDCVDHNELWKILQEMQIREHLTCLLRNVREGQEATVRTGHETMDCFKIGKGVC